MALLKVLKGKAVWLADCWEILMVGLTVAWSEVLKVAMTDSH
jgi:hypothetical protein